MKKIFFLITSLIAVAGFSQDFNKKWQLVYALENEGKTKVASEEVDKIYALSKSKKNEVQLIKTFFYRSKFLLVKEENAQAEILANLNSEIILASEPAKAILKTIYVDCLKSYFNEHSYEIKDRTVTELHQSDYKLWTETDFLRKIEELYELKSASKELLKNTPLENYKEILKTEKTEAFDKLSVYDYVMNSKIETYLHFLKNQDYGFNARLGNFKEFVYSIDEFKDASRADIKNDLSAKTIAALQELEQIHPSDFRIIIKRVENFKNLLTIDNQKYIHLLNRLQKRTNDENVSQEILLKKAQTFQILAENELHSTHYKSAVNALDSILKNQNRSNTYKQAILLKDKITSKHLSIDLKRILYENENIRAFVSFKNTDSLSIKFYKIPRLLTLAKDRLANDTVVLNHVKGRNPFTSIKVPLPKTADFYHSTTEILLPKLEIANYVAIIQEKDAPLTIENIYYNFVVVTNLVPSYFSTNGKDVFQVFNRKTGIPIKGVMVKVNGQTIETDAKGYAIFEKNFKKENKREAHFYNNLDSLTITYSNYRDKTAYDPETSKLEHSLKATILTDRAIYRPGQKLYGKGIVTQKKDGKESTLQNTLVYFEILDAKNNKLNEFILPTNEFGSFTFEFDIPKNVLTGQFTISVREFSNADSYSDDYISEMKNTTRNFYFSVEEYKRPTFEISFDKVNDDLQLNQEVSVNGRATAFSGSKIAGAKVLYSITQHKKSLNYDYMTTDEFPALNGEVTTDSDGKFSISFKATPESSVDISTLPTYQFYITATITDINGETHDKSTKVNIGNHAHVLKTVIDQNIDVIQTNFMSLSSHNLNDVFVPIKGKVDFYLTHEDKTNFKERFFQTPEVQTISDEEFKTLFPYERYESYASLSLNHKELVHSLNVDTSHDNTLNLDFLKNKKLGSYVAIFTATDKFGNKISSEETFYLSNSEDTNAKLIVIKQLNKDPKKDGFVLVKLMSKIPNLFVETEAYFSSKTIYQNEFVMKSNEQILKIPIDENIDNSIQIKVSSFFENSSFDERTIVKIEPRQEKFEIETISLRNKIEPGQNETWSFKINSDSKENAEILASMYDSSLDQFKFPYWQEIKKNAKYNNYPVSKNYLATTTSVNTTLRNLNIFKSYINLKDETIKLNTFGFSFTNDYYVKRRYQDDLRSEKFNFKMPANSKIISGYVTDPTGPLPGASIVVVGTTRGTQSDIDGYYIIEASKNETLMFTHTGYKAESRKADKHKIDIKLVEGDGTIDEVVVTAYGIMRETGELTYATKIYDANENPITALAGKVSGLNFEKGNTMIVLRGYKSIDESPKLIIVDGVVIEDITNIDSSEILTITTLDSKKSKALYGSAGKSGALIINTKASLKELMNVITRKNFDETAFFYPQIHTDKNGNFSFNFKSPEALTQWKLRLFAHDKKASSAYFEQMIVNQKKLMVTPNLPRFLREKDSITITTKISNLTNESKSGMAMLQLFDAVSMEPIDAKMLHLNSAKSFQMGAKENTSVSWKIYVPEGLQGIQYKIVAKSGNFSDGEENILPVLTNNMLVTESIPVWVRENSSKEYTFENLKNNTSTTLRNQQLTLEYTSNPTWLAVQALPYLMEYEHECAEQTFARYYANALASEILNSNPKIAEVFESWKKLEKPLSKLEQNEELKSVLLAETPWITDALSEEEKKKNLATLFDLQKMKDSQKAILEKLTKKQKASGGFSWFDDGNESEYITRHIISGLGHLQKLSKNATGDFDEITKKGIGYLDQKFLENSKKTEINNNSQKLIWINPYNNLHYLYARSFYLEKYPLDEKSVSITKRYTSEIKQNWLNYSLYEKGLASLVLNRFGEKETAKKILESLRQTSSNNEDWGMYWIENKAGWYWYQAPIETQALLIEAFAEIENDKKSVDAMKVWLLKNKQNKNWPTTKATTEAVFALLMQGNDWISVKDKTIIKLGDEKIATKKLAENEKEAGTGYIKMTWKADEITKEMATVSIQNKSEVSGFGGFYWRYFEDLDKIKSSQESPMMIEKELYLKNSTSEGNQLQKITQEKPLKIGDLVTVRLVISTKEDMEFVHLKDMRASCFEPTDVLSKYKWQDGLGYYQSTKDVATHFFFDKINKGKFVLEYDIRVNNLGDFSNGISTIQSMYAPEFASHTKGIRVKITE